MSYEDAPATKMLATSCCVCGRPLLDATSVEIGMGPTCREKYGYGDPVPEAARTEANGLVQRAALIQSQNPQEMTEIVTRLNALGLRTLAGKLASVRLSLLEVQKAGDVYRVVTPFNAEFISRVRSIRGRRWDGEKKINLIPLSEKRALWEALKASYPGAMLKTDDGLVRVPDGTKVTKGQQISIEYR